MSDFRIWKIVNGKTIYKIDNGFIIVGMSNHDAFFVPDLASLKSMIKGDDVEQIKRHLIEEGTKGKPREK